MTSQFGKRGYYCSAANIGAAHSLRIAPVLCESQAMASRTSTLDERRRVSFDETERIDRFIRMGFFTKRVDFIANPLSHLISNTHNPGGRSPLLSPF